MGVYTPEWGLRKSIYDEWHRPAGVIKWETLRAWYVHGNALYKYPPLLIWLTFPVVCNSFQNKYWPNNWKQLTIVREHMQICKNIKLLSELLYIFSHPITYSNRP